MPTLILLGGKAQSGKDTCADILMDILPGEVDRFAFAGEMKKSIARIYGLDDRHLYGDLKEDPLDDIYKNYSININQEASAAAEQIEEIPDFARFMEAGLVRSSLSGDTLEIRLYHSPRTLMQDFGQKVREIYKDTWVLSVWKSARRSLEGGKDVVVTDCRYPNEYSLIGRSEEEGFNSIPLYLKRNHQGSVADHASEDHSWIDSDDYDWHFIHNDGRGGEGLKKLESKLKCILESRDIITT